MVIKHFWSIGITITSNSFCKVFLATALARKFRAWPQPLLSMDHNCYQYRTSHRLVLSSYIIVFPVPQGVSIIVHVFADASLKAYGAVAFIQQGKEPALILMSKTRAAPLKQLTLPKLELNAAVLVARLAHLILKYLTINLTVQMWSDSQTVLHWISSQKALKPYVSHRVAEILSVSNKWNYVPSADNPADLLTRGITFQQLSSSTIWQHGPPWLLSVENWPIWDPTGVLVTQSEINIKATTLDRMKVVQQLASWTS